MKTKRTKNKIIPGLLTMALLFSTPLYAAEGGMNHGSMGGMNMNPYTPIEVGKTEQEWGDHTFKISVAGDEWKVGKNLKVTMMVMRRYKKKMRPVKNADISADLTMPEMGHNLENGLRFVEGKPGYYSATIRIEMAGTYGLLFNFQKGSKMHSLNFNFVAKK